MKRFAASCKKVGLEHRFISDIEMESWYYGTRNSGEVFQESVNGKCRMCWVFDSDAENGEPNTFC